MMLYFKSQPKRVLKKLPQNRRELVLQALLEVERNPYLGEPKLGNLTGVQTYRFKVFQEIWLIAYTFIDVEALLILKIGPRENFYKDI
ncbi:MAG: type II toxin-antitoxin system RelE/ParE family toxin [Candidatus Nanopelagicaceae bacterium]